jgi:PTS system nitrogen regulatory IIA component
MKLMDFVVPKAIIANLSATDRNGVIRELVGALASAGAINPDDAETLIKSVIQRENQGSTGFGKGVAVPHVKHESIPRIMAAVGRSAAGVDFSALDRAPVYAVVLLASPSNNPDGHLQAMEKIFKHLQQDNFRRLLRQAETHDAVVELLQEADQQ